MHQLWHVAVLGWTLFAVAGAAIALLGPVAFETPPPGLTRARPVVLGLIVPVAAVLLIVEWTAVH
ncbi:MAG: hypothetical protein H0V60_05730 [Actinobacteria bacterium]|nr:hypothetical protein [Actinomycetota bacterium]